MISKNTNSKVLLLGGAGFIGANIAKYLLLNGSYEVTIADNFTRGSERLNTLHALENTKGNLEIIDIDLTNPIEYRKLSRTYDYVYLLAAIVGVDKVNSVPHEVIRTNSMLVINCLEWLKTISAKRVVFTSTSEVYAGTVELFGANLPTTEEVPLTIERVDHPRFSYAITKILGESGFLNYARAGFFEAVVVRYHNVYGPGMGFRHVIPHLIERFSNLEDPFKIYGHNQTRSFNYIDDAVRGTVGAAEFGFSGEIYHIGSPDEISIEVLTRYIGTKFNYRGNFEAAPTFPGSVSRRCPDISKAKQHFNYEPLVDWKSGLGKTIDWYRNYLENNSDELHESFYDQYGVGE